MSYSVWLFLHHFTYLTLIPAILLHAAAAWEYILPAVTIWFFDRLLRLYRGIKAVNLVSSQQASLCSGETFHRVNMFSPASIDPRFLTPEATYSIHNHSSYRQEKVFFQPLTNPALEEVNTTTTNHRTHQQTHGAPPSTSSLSITSTYSQHNTSQQQQHEQQQQQHDDFDKDQPLPVSSSFIHSLSSITNVSLQTQLPTTEQIHRGHGVPLPTTTKHDPVHNAQVITAEALGGNNPAINFSGPGVRIVDRGLAGKFVELRIVNDCMVYFPGHYAFLNIAEISLFEWHPFTIASPAHFCARSEIVFIIKTMGPGTWTQSLYDYIYDYYQRVGADFVEDFVDVPLTVSLDGPIGTPIDFTTYDVVICLAGGIGITPCKSIFESLLLSYLHDFKSRLLLKHSQEHLAKIKENGGSNLQQQQQQQQQYPQQERSHSALSAFGNTMTLTEPNTNPILQSLGIHDIPLVETNKRVHLMWSARDIQLFDLMAESLSAIPYGPFSAALYADNPAEMPQQVYTDAERKQHCLPPSVLKLINTGRPNLEAEFLRIVNGLNPNSYLNASNGDGPYSLREDDTYEQDDNDNENNNGSSSVNNNNNNQYDSSTNLHPLNIDPNTVNALRAMEQSADSRGPVNPTSSRHGGFSSEETRRVLVFVCGPGPMAQDAERVCQKHGWDFHQETFAL